MVINLSEKHSLLSNWISELRDSEMQTDRMRLVDQNLKILLHVARCEGVRIVESDDDRDRAFDYLQLTLLDGAPDLG